MATLKLYRTYNFKDKDPVIDEIRNLIEEEGLIKKLNIVHQLSGVATQTLDNWLNGTTVSPQNRTICAVVSSLGYERQFTKTRDINLEKELKLAKQWMEQQKKVQEKTERLIAARKKRKAKERRENRPNA